MSDFTNPSSGATDAGDSYTRAILDLLGERDPMEVLRSTARALRDLVAGIAVGDLLRPEAPGKWSALEVVQHLADSEIAWSWRLRLVLAEESPQLTGYDQDAWANRLGYREEAVEDALSLFGVLRAANLRLLDRLSEDDLDRAGIHVERGPETVRHMIDMYAGHDLVHRDQLSRIVKRTRATASGPSSPRTATPAS